MTSIWTRAFWCHDMVQQKKLEWEMNTGILRNRMEAPLKTARLTDRLLMQHTVP